MVKQKSKRSEGMNNINWNWETHFSIDSSVLLKIGVVILLLFWGFDELRKRRKKKPSIEASISEANARESHEWRYVRYPFKVIRVVFTLYILWSLIQYLLT